MCGIAGAYGLSDKPLLRRMMAIMAYRGPDGEGTFLDQDVMLGNQRLSVIDLVTGDQPIYNEEGDIAIVYNGEIYNFRELRAELEEKGHRFKTRSDTEVIVHGYEEWGVHGFTRLNGMFAFALWDGRRGELIFARDRNGIKPLYYAETSSGTLFFASEPKALLLCPGVNRAVDLDAVHHYLNLRYVPREKTMFRGIRKLLAGHVLRASAGGISTSPYWEPRFVRRPRSEAELVGLLRTEFEQAVKRHMISDVPVGVHISGGIDSTSVIAVASQFTDEPLHTFTLGFGEPTDELDDARLVAERFGTNHREIVVHRSLLKDLPRMIWHADGPKRNLYPYYLSELTSRHVKVVLLGLGGDELFAGYIWKYEFARHVEALRQSLEAKRRSALAQHARSLLAFQTGSGRIGDDVHNGYLKTLANLRDDSALYLQVQSADEVLSEDQAARVYGPTLLKAPRRPVAETFRFLFEAKNGHLVERFLEADYRVKMVDDFLFVEDAMEMAHSVESRLPFLDHRMVDLAFSIPADMKWRPGEGKLLLKKVVSDWVPREVLAKRKQGFGSDVTETFRREIREQARAQLPDGLLVKAGIVQSEYVKRVLDHPIDRRLEQHYSLAWNLLALEVWWDIYVEREAFERPPGNAIM